MAGPAQPAERYLHLTRAQAGHRPALLTEQFRMHPAISAWPSKFFYDGRLRDAPSVAGDRASGAASSRAATFHRRACFGPLAFFDCQEVGCRDEGAGGVARRACTWWRAAPRAGGALQIAGAVPQA
jgi:hypothetical protein